MQFLNDVRSSLQEKVTAVEGFVAKAKSTTAAVARTTLSVKKSTGFMQGVFDAMNDDTNLVGNFLNEIGMRPPSIGISVTFGGMTGTLSTSGAAGSFTPGQLWGFGVSFQNRVNISNTMVYRGASEKLSVGFYPFDKGKWWEKSMSINVGGGSGWQTGIDYQLTPQGGL